MRTTLPVIAVTLAGAVAATALAPTAQAALAVGKRAQDFTTQGALDGNIAKLHLAEQLKKGPVVLYFFPAAFTPGCSAEAQAFAASIDEFHKAGATVIGMSADPIAKLADFSKKDCASKFTVAVADPAIIKNYDVALTYKNASGQTQTITNRTSYVIGRDGKIVYAYTDPGAALHVKNSLDAVRRYAAARH